MQNDDMEGRFFFNLKGDYIGKATWADHHCLVMKLTKNKKI